MALYRFFCPQALIRFALTFRPLIPPDVRQFCRLNHGSFVGSPWPAINFISGSFGGIYSCAQVNYLLYQFDQAGTLYDNERPLLFNSYQFRFAVI